MKWKHRYKKLQLNCKPEDLYKKLHELNDPLFYIIAKLPAKMILCGKEYLTTTGAIAIIMTLKEFHEGIVCGEIKDKEIFGIMYQPHNEQDQWVTG